MRAHRHGHKKSYRTEYVGIIWIHSVDDPRNTKSGLSNSFFFFIVYLRSVYFSFYITAIIEWGMARDCPWKHRLAIYAIFVYRCSVLLDFLVRRFAARKLPFTSINDTSTIYEWLYKKFQFFFRRFSPLRTFGSFRSFVRNSFRYRDRDWSYQFANILQFTIGNYRTKTW